MSFQEDRAYLEDRLQSATEQREYSQHQIKIHTAKLDALAFEIDAIHDEVAWLHGG